MKIYALVVVGLNLGGSLVSLIVDDDLNKRVTDVVCAVIYGIAIYCIWGLR